MGALPMGELQLPSAQCPHANLPDQQQQALKAFKMAVLNKIAPSQETAGINVLLAGLIISAAQQNLGMYQPLPDNLDGNRDPQSLMAQAVQALANLNAQLHAPADGQRATVNELQQVTAEAFAEVKKIVEPTILLALHMEYAANLNVQSLQKFNVPAKDPAMLLALALQTITRLNRQAHVQEAPDQ
jgi:hypothetical protein